ncbi:hypothetical protein PR202_gb14417 [Eleusine coracana subsp. coracana]|uniref:Terpene synthase metal-binding domain-containing protein n=1 Tax=Eleusine coracana subsp. coracana TaxID=191504 RepID=A0AAV5EW96_ELECO|nr:hypothetical protein PR202_gb14417 [Eleusine coracana subsp. coracana]
MANAVKTTGYFSSLPCGEVTSTRLSRTSRSCAGLTRSAVGLCCSMNHEQAGDLRSVKEPLSTPFRNHDHEDKALQYKDLFISKVGGAEHPKRLHCQLYMVDALEKMGISRYFSCQIKSILDMAYRWVKDSKLDQLPFARQKLAYFYLSAAGTMFPPEMSDARIFWAQNGVLTTVVDDFFDVGGSKEELDSLVRLVEMYDSDPSVLKDVSHVQYFLSSACFLDIVNQKASALQDRDVTKHLVQIWLDLLRAMMTEVEWRMSNYVPSAEEYITNSALTFALGPIVLPALYLVGPKVPESVVRDPEYNELFRLMSTCGRLLNDIQGYEREYTEGKVNSVSLLVLQSGGSMSIQEARKEIQKPIENCRRELLRLVLRREAAVPRPCKELFWKMCKVCCFFYSRSDGFSSPEEKAPEVNAVIQEPLLLLDASLHRSPPGGVTELFPSA